MLAIAAVFATACGSHPRPAPPAPATATTPTRPPPDAATSGPGWHIEMRDGQQVTVIDSKPDLDEPWTLEGCVTDCESDSIRLGRDPHTCGQRCADDGAHSQLAEARDEYSATVYDEALTDAERALALRPDLAAAHELAAEAACQLHRPDRVRFHLAHLVDTATVARVVALCQQLGVSL